MATVGTVLINVKARTTHMAKGLNKARARLRRFQKSVRRNFGGVIKMASLAGAAIIAGIGMALVSTMKTFAEFESKIAETRAILRGLSDEGFAPLIAMARELGKTTVFSATEAAEAMTFLARAGFKVNEVMEAVPHLLNLAAAAGMELSVAADIVAQVIRGMGLEVAEAARVADVLALASARANTNVEMLGQAFSHVAPVANALNLTLEETTALLATLSDAGLQADRAGTGLKAILAELAEEIEQNGVRALHDLIEGGISAADAFARFGKRGAPAILALVRMKVKAGELLEELEDATGVAKEMAAVRLDTLEGSVRLLKSAWQELQLILGGDLAPTVRVLVDSFTALIQAAGQSLTGMQKDAKASAFSVNQVTEALITLVESAAGVLKFFGRFVTWIKGVFHIFGLIITGALTLVAASVAGFVFSVLEIWKSLPWTDSAKVEREMAGVLGIMKGFASETARHFRGLREAQRGIFSDDSAIDEWVLRTRNNVYQNLRRAGEEGGEGLIEGLAASLESSAHVIGEIMTEEMLALGEATESLAKWIEKQEQAIEVFGMSTDAAELYRAKQAGVSEEMIRQAQALKEQMDALKAQEELMAKGARLAIEMRTPHEKYADTVKELEELLEKGAISQEIFRRAMLKAKEDLAEALPEAMIEDAFAGGVGDIKTALGAFKFGMDPQTKIAEKQLTQEEKQVELLMLINQNLKVEKHPLLT